MTDQEITLGEVVRTLQRLDRAVTRMADTLGTLATIDVRVTHAESHIQQLRADVDQVATKAAAISGGVTVVGFLLSLWPWHK